MRRKMVLIVIAALMVIGLCPQPAWAKPTVGENDPLPGEIAKVKSEGTHAFLTPNPDGRVMHLGKGTVVQFEVRQLGKDRVYRLNGRLPARVVVKWLNGLWIPKPFTPPLWVETWQIEAGIFDLNRPATVKEDPILS